MNGMEGAFALVFGAVCVLILAVTVFTAVKLFSQWRTDNASPLRSVDAMVVSRRTDVRRGARSIGGRPTGAVDASTGAPTTGATTLGTSATSSTSYFVTFEEPSGERRELQLSGRDYGQLAEGDRGHLIHQGARFKGFTRQGAVDGIR